MTDLTAIRRGLNLPAATPHDKRLPFTPDPDAFYAWIGDTIYSQPYGLGLVPCQVAVQGKLVERTYHEMGLRCEFGPVPERVNPIPISALSQIVDRQPMQQLSFFDFANRVAVEAGL